MTAQRDQSRKLFGALFRTTYLNALEEFNVGWTGACGSIVIAGIVQNVCKRPRVGHSIRGGKDSGGRLCRQSHNPKTVQAWQCRIARVDHETFNEVRSWEAEGSIRWRCMLLICAPQLGSARILLAKGEDHCAVLRTKVARSQAPFGAY